MKKVALIVLLAPFPDVQVRATNPLGKFNFEGARVRWVADAELMRQCPWLDGNDQWRAIDASVLELGPLPQRGLDGPVGFEWARVETCTVVYPMQLLDPVDIWREGVRSERFNLVVSPHASHVVPRLRFQDAQGVALAGAKVRLVCNGLRVRDLTTDAQGEVLVDVHAFDEDQRDATLRVEFSKGDESMMTAELSLAEVRAQGIYVLGDTHQTVEVKVHTDRPAAFSVALAATHSTRSTDLKDAGVEESFEVIEMDPEDALSHARAETLQFHPFDSAGRATLSTSGWSTTRCVIVRHNATGLMVAGQCCVPGDASIELLAPKLGTLTVQPDRPTEAPWKVLLTGNSYQFDGLFLASQQCPIVLTPDHNRAEIPQGGYSMNAFGERGYSSESTLYINEPEGTFRFELPVFRHVRGLVKRRFDDAALPEVVVMYTRFNHREEIQLNPDGSFEVWVAETVSQADLNLSLRLPQGGNLHWTALPVDPYADVLEFFVEEARLRVAPPSLPLVESLWVQLSGTGFRNTSHQQVKNGYAEFYLQPGTYLAQASVQGAQPLQGIELAAGDDVVVNLPHQDIGAVAVTTDAPVGGYVTLNVAVPSDELNFEVGSFFTWSQWVQASQPNESAYDFAAVAQDYVVTAALRYNVSQTSVVTVSETFVYKVRANEIGTIEVKLLDKLLDKLREGAASKPDYAAALVKLGG